MTRPQTATTNKTNLDKQVAFGRSTMYQKNSSNKENIGQLDNLPEFDSDKKVEFKDEEEKDSVFFIDDSTST